MSTELVMGIATIIGAVIGAIASITVCIINNNKQNALMMYRLEQLENKVDKHNSVVERMYIAEGKIESMQSDIKELKAG